MTAIDLQTYIGTKIIGAMPQQNNGADGYMVTYEDGYVSWSPKDVFEKAYRKTDAMTFGDALVMLKKGVMVQRRGVGTVQLLGDANSAVPMLVHAIGGPGSLYEPSLHDMLAEDWQVVE